MSVIIDSLREILRGREVQNCGVFFFPRTLEITHLRQWLTKLTGKAEFVSLNYADKNFRGRPRNRQG